MFPCLSVCSRAQAELTSEIQDASSVTISSLFLSLSFLFIYVFYLFILLCLFTYFTGVSILPVCMFVHHVGAWCPLRSEVRVKPPGTGAVRLLGSKPWSLCWVFPHAHAMVDDLNLSKMFVCTRMNTYADWKVC